MKIQPLAITLCLIALLIVASPVAMGEEPAEGGKVDIPTTASAVLAKVKQSEQDLGKMIADKKLDNVHEIAFAVRDLVAALPDKSADLTADKMGKLRSNVKFVADLAARLDESGDRKDQAATEANFKKLQGILKSIDSLYSGKEPAK